VRSKLVARRERWTLTWTGRLLALAVAVAATIIVGRSLYAFLAVNAPVYGQVLVVEGWLPAYAYREAATQFRKGGYRKVITAPLTRNEVELDGRRDERLAVHKLVEFGVPADMVVMVSHDDVPRDRTFHFAVSVKAWLHGHGFGTAPVDVVTMGAHARRSRLLFEKALGEGVAVGVIPVQDRQFDPDHWWQSSAGFRRVTNELIAYLYARFVF
jgi:uncharacterized SAM-binding protein YcdF (DUF218 family)